MRVKDSRQTFLGVWFRRVVEDEAFEVWGGRQKRDLCYIDDAVDAFLAAAASPAADGRIFNIGGSAPVSLAELAGLLIDVAGRGRFETREFPPDLLRIDIGDYFADDSLFRGLTGWTPRVPLREGIARTLAFYEERLNEYV
jgi:UDP-glucose 4-epimerase